MSLILKSAALAVATVCISLSATDPPIVYVSPVVLDRSILSAAMPLYPAQSLKVQHSGIVAADVHVSPKGTVEGVKLLQAPDALIGSEVIKTLSKWTFRPAKAVATNEALGIEGRVLLYFSLEHGTPQVIDLVAKHLREEKR